MVDPTASMLEDKANFKVFRFPDETVYYGEVAYVDQAGKLVFFYSKQNRSTTSRRCPRRRPQNFIG